MYNHAPADYICPLCLAVQGIENQHTYCVGADVVHRNEAVTALISSFQWQNNPGHVIIIPNQHFENIYDLTLHLAVEVHRLAQAVAIAMRTAYACDGVSTRQHNEPAGNQDVWHYHLHVFPRYAGDNLYDSSSRKQLMPAGERAIYAARLKRELHL